MKVLLSAIVVSFAITSAVDAWGPNGHRITAQIAEDRLSDAARSAVRSIAGERSLALLATWPDFIRSFKEYDCFKPMHFLTVEDGQDFDEALKVKPFKSRNCTINDFEEFGLPSNVVSGINYFAAILAGDNQKTAGFTEFLQQVGAEPLEGSVHVTALALLVHLVGDVHQPLHVGRGPDLGGNAITVNWFDETQNFHWVWDEGLIDKEALSFTEYADFLAQDFADRPAIGFGDGPKTWALESVSHRGAVYDWGGHPNYNVPKLSYVYAAQQNALLNERLFMGGARLADLLNQIFGN